MRTANGAQKRYRFPAIYGIACCVLGLLASRCASTRSGYPDLQEEPGIAGETARFTLQESRHLFAGRDDRNRARICFSEAAARYRLYQAEDSLAAAADSAEAVRPESSNEPDSREKRLARAREQALKGFEADPGDMDGIVLTLRILTDSMARTGPAAPDRWRSAITDLINRGRQLDRGRSDLPFLAGEACRNLGQWKAAGAHYRQAESLLLAYDFLPLNPLSDSTVSFLDTLRLYLYRTRIAETFIRRYEPDSARNVLRRIMELPVSPELKIRVRNTLQWIDWAGGNIRLRETYDAARELENRGKNRDAARIYRDLLNRLDSKTSRAFRETAWRLARLEYAGLSGDSLVLSETEGGPVAEDRLASVVRDLPEDSLGRGRPSFAQKLVEDYARMLYNRAEEELIRSGDRRKAEIRYARCALWPSSVQGKAALRKARIVQNARGLGLVWILAAYAHIGDLNAEELREFSVLSRRVTRRPRNPVLMAFFNSEMDRLLTGGPGDLAPEIRTEAMEYLRTGYILLQRYFQKEFQVRTGQDEIERYSRLYEGMEIRLSPAERTAVRRRISEYYNRTFSRRTSERFIIDTWRRRLRELGARPEREGKW